MCRFNDPIHMWGQKYGRVLLWVCHLVTTNVLCNYFGDLLYINNDIFTYIHQYIHLYLQTRGRIVHICCGYTHDIYIHICRLDVWLYIYLLCIYTRYIHLYWKYGMQLFWSACPLATLLTTTPRDLGWWSTNLKTAPFKRKQTHQIGNFAHEACITKSWWIIVRFELQSPY